MTKKYARYLRLAASNRQWNAIQLAELAEGDFEQQLRDGLRSQDYEIDPASSEADRWTDDDYLVARSKCLAAVKDHSDLTSKEAQASWDSKLSGVILEAFPFSRYDAMRIETWRYVALKVVPDLTLLRYRPNGSLHDQIFGRVDRNVIGRLWLRADYEREAPGLMRDFKEDNLTGLFERTSLVSNPRVGLVVAQEVAELYKRGLGPNNKEELIRDFYKRLVRLMAVRNFDLMPEPTLRIHISEAMAASLKQFV